jgi:hypothetical protein
MSARAHYNLALDNAREAADAQLTAIAHGHAAHLAASEGISTAALDHLTAAQDHAASTPALRPGWLASRPPSWQTGASTPQHARPSIAPAPPSTNPAAAPPRVVSLEHDGPGRRYWPCARPSRRSQRRPRDTHCGAQPASPDPAPATGADPDRSRHSRVEQRKLSGCVLPRHPGRHCPPPRGLCPRRHPPARLLRRCATPSAQRSPARPRRVPNPDRSLTTPAARMSARGFGSYPFLAELADLCDIGPAPHKIQRLPHGEVEASIHGALGLPTPELPVPWYATNPTLAVFVHIMLLEQHNHTSKQPHRLFLEDWRRDRFFTSKLTSQLRKLF